jgi:hypothetical protein
MTKLLYRMGVALKWLAVGFVVLVVGVIVVGVVSDGVSAKPECGKSMHDTVMQVANNNLSPGEPRMLDLWDDREAAPRDDDPQNVTLRCWADAKYTDTSYWRIHYLAHDEHDKSWVRVERVKRTNADGR